MIRDHHTRRWLELSMAGCVLMTVVSCGDASTHPKPPVWTDLSAVSPTTLRGTVGTVVEDSPSIIARDSLGRPVAGVVIIFTVTEGGGLAQSRTAVTDSRGIATADRWRLGTVPGRNALEARNPTGDAVEFIVDAAAGPPTTISKFGGDGQAGQPGAALFMRPRVRVSDAWDNPVPGVAVTFEVAAGGGSVSDAPTLTDSAGIASSGDWVLGGAGAQRLVARAGQLASQPFSARVVTAAVPCTDSGVLKGESATFGQLSALGCNVYTIVVELMGTYTFSVGSPDFDTNIQLRGGSSGLDELAGNDDVAVGTTNSGFSVLLVPGTYTLSVSSSRPGTSGTFDVRYNYNVFVVDGCAEAFAVRGIDVRGIAYSGCAPEADNPADRFRIYFEAGDPINIEVEDWSYSGPNIRMIAPDGQQLEAAAGANYLTRMQTTAPVSGYYLVMVGLAHESGLEYELRIR